MDVVPYLEPVRRHILQLSTTHPERVELRVLFGQEMQGREPETAIPHFAFPEQEYFDHDAFSVSGGDLFNDGQEWTATDTAFGRRYLVFVNNRGSFALMALLPGLTDVLVEFQEAVPNSGPGWHPDDVLMREQAQLAKCLTIAAEVITAAKPQRP